MKYRLECKAGWYEADSLTGLAWYVFTHRLGHLLRGDGWVD